jgi:hypothetical protein
VFMYGTAVLAIKGPVTLEPITCQVRQVNCRCKVGQGGEQCCLRGAPAGGLMLSGRSGSSRASGAGCC